MTPRDDIALIATLNDLLQLEHDALPAYGLAILAMQDGGHRERLEGFRAEHLRHMQELTGLIEAHGALPMALPHIPTGMLKLGVQMAGLPGGDRAILLAFRANEWQSQMKYARLAEGDHAPEVARVLRRAAADEAKHYAWAVEVLDGMGLGNDTTIGVANSSFAQFHGLMAELLESAARNGIETMARFAHRGAAGWQHAAGWVPEAGRG